MESDELQRKFLLEILRTKCKFEDKAKSLRKALKLLKGKANLSARVTLNRELKHIESEFSNLYDLEYKIEIYDE